MVSKIGLSFANYSAEGGLPGDPQGALEMLGGTRLAGASWVVRKACLAFNMSSCASEKDADKCWQNMCNSLIVMLIPGHVAVLLDTCLPLRLSSPIVLVSFPERTIRNWLAKSPLSTQLSCATACDTQIMALHANSCSVGIRA